MIEALLAICVGGILLAVSGPLYSKWVQTTAQKEATHRLAGHIKETRSKAITQNLQHRLEFDLQNNQYRITRGDRPNNSSDASWASNVLMGWHPLGDALDLKASKECGTDVAADAESNPLEFLSFNGSGTGSTGYLCIQDSNGGRVFRVGVPYFGTGNVVIHSKAPGSDAWH